MKLHEMKPTPNSRHYRKRVGRGIGSGMGKTSTRGQKGQWARSGASVRLGFEGGQNPLYRRIPKRGFNNINKKVYTIINLDTIEKSNLIEITPEILLRQKVIRKLEKDGLKVLANGTLTKKINLKTNKISLAAKELIEKKGGSVELFIK